jgi:hypothetical protein
MIKLINNILFRLAKDNWKGAIEERERLNKVIEKQKQKMIKYGANK